MTLAGGRYGGARVPDSRPEEGRRFSKNLDS
ncbi:MAG: hypothetical protein QOC94_1224 [Actinoplanes sp.]|jgi:hypothetical protein|nr:hypothetical protein [Actinoplanes sp.]